MKKAAIILFVLQGLAVFGNLSGGGRPLYAMGIPELIGFFLPTIIGVILLNKHNKKNK